MRNAQALNADVVLIDQLSHIRHPDPRNKPRNEVVRDIMQDLAVYAQDPSYPLPVWVFAQVGRKGHEDATKRGYYAIDDFAECFDDQTEIMSEHGWKFFADLVEGEKVATRSSSGDLVYQVPVAYIAKPYRGLMYTYRQRNLDFVVTPGHRMLVKNAWCRSELLRFERVSDLGNERYLTPRRTNPVQSGGASRWFTFTRRFRSPLACGGVPGGRWSQQEDEYLVQAYPRTLARDMCSVLPWRSRTAIQLRARGFGLKRMSSDWSSSQPELLQKTLLVDFAAFVGFWVAEGKKAREGYAVKVTQSKPQGIDWVDALFMRLGWPHKRVVGAKEVSWVVFSPELQSFLWQLCVGEARPGDELVLPAECFDGSWSPRVCEALLEGLCQGDGSWNMKEQRFDYYLSSSKRLVDDVQRLLVHLGMMGNVGVNYQAGRPFVSPNGKTYKSRLPGYRVRIDASTRYAQIFPANLKREPYDGMVYCLRVPNETILVRRNGIPMWTGNSSETERSADVGFTILQTGDRASSSGLVPDGLRPPGAAQVVGDFLVDRLCPASGFTRDETSDPDGEMSMALIRHHESVQLVALCLDMVEAGEKGEDTKSSVEKAGEFILGLIDHGDVPLDQIMVDLAAMVANLLYQWDPELDPFVILEQYMPT